MTPFMITCLKKFLSLIFDNRFLSASLKKIFPLSEDIFFSYNSLGFADKKRLNLTTCDHVPFTGLTYLIVVPLRERGSSQVSMQ